MTPMTQMRATLAAGWRNWRRKLARSIAPDDAVGVFHAPVVRGEPAEKAYISFVMAGVDTADLHDQLVASGCYAIADELERTGGISSRYEAEPGDPSNGLLLTITFTERKTLLN